MQHMCIPVMRDLSRINFSGINIEFSIVELKNEISSLLEAFTNAVAISVKSIIVF